MQQYVNVPISCAIPLNTNWHIDILFNFPNKACRLSKKSGYSSGFLVEAKLTL